jgi:hypothetical protein
MSEWMIQEQSWVEGSDQCHGDWTKDEVPVAIALHPVYKSNGLLCESKAFFAAESARPA